MSVYPMRLKPGQEIKQCLEDFVAENGLKAAFILTCCGSVTKATLRFAANKNNETNRVRYVLEINKFNFNNIIHALFFM